jgi:hypothetical protein
MRRKRVVAVDKLAESAINLDLQKSKRESPESERRRSGRECEVREDDAENGGRLIALIAATEQWSREEIAETREGRIKWKRIKREMAKMPASKGKVRERERERERAPGCIRLAAAFSFGCFVCSGRIGAEGIGLKRARERERESEGSGSR